MTTKVPILATTMAALLMTACTARSLPPAGTSVASTACCSQTTIFDSEPGVSSTTLHSGGTVPTFPSGSGQLKAYGVSATQLVRIVGSVAAPDVSAQDLDIEFESGLSARMESGDVVVLTTNGTDYENVSIDVTTGDTSVSTPQVDGQATVFENRDTHLVVTMIEGETNRFGVVGSAGEVVWIDDSDVIPLAPAPDGGFLLRTGDGSLGIVGEDGMVTAYETSFDLPPAWSGAFGPEGLLALGLSTNQVVIINPGSGLLVLDGLPDTGSPIDIVWTAGGSVLLVNSSAPTINDSGIFACNLADLTPCTKIVDWTPDLRLAHS